MGPATDRFWADRMTAPWGPALRRSSTSWMSPSPSLMWVSPGPSPRGQAATAGPRQGGDGGLGGGDAAQPLEALLVLDGQALGVGGPGIGGRPAPVVLMQQADGHAIRTQGQGRVQVQAASAGAVVEGAQASGMPQCRVIER